ncbi:hypothetical protein CAPTEDRAFT_176768 [Capitella teleta]|uniref:Uncharacterized protein n=1 Tax=Capitella teleta TaxID=283909 RepID=R7VD82_CAPTE|nr:hypothetical protein CAPTEDRAFT_176768 [Capitella teleta]|eukprot:ELU13640.1 hypothetical protein CAPTEDRAFT_176768 [Capitella teleta]
MFGGSSFAVHQDSNLNANQALKKAKSMLEDGKMAQGTKRTALGTITNTTRVQPLRAAKGKVTDYKSFNTGLDGKPFTIHQDDAPAVRPPPASAVPAFKTAAMPMAVDQVENRAPRLPSAVTALRPVPGVFAHHSIDCDESIASIESSESPMLLDSSRMELDNADPELRNDRILCAQEYASEIYAYLREAETRNRARVGYMRKQPDVTASMRSILVDWLVEVAEEYKLHRETLFLAVNYIDRFLSQMSVLRGKLQLVGAASLFLAAKYEEIYPPEVGEFVYITDDTYKTKQVLRMEHLILKVLSFDVAVPTINLFVEKFAKESGSGEATQSLAMYLAELTLVDGEPFHKYCPSVLAASALCLARYTRGMEAWPETLCCLTDYRMVHLSECLHDLHKVYLVAPNHPQQAVREKYRDVRFQEVATLPPPLDLPPGTIPCMPPSPEMVAE